MADETRRDQPAPSRQRRRRGRAHRGRHQLARHYSSDERVFRIALAGNPNAGKTSLFNAITGQHQHIGNYPGVTVETTLGRITRGDLTVELVDLPGTYSLSAYSMEEMVARDFVLTEKPDLIVDVLDAANLERNLYLLLQLQELGVPVVGVLNMMDEAEQAGIEIDTQQLSTILGIPLVETVGHRGRGTDKLMELIFEIASGKRELESRQLNYGREVEARRGELLVGLGSDPAFGKRYQLEWVAIKLLENDRDAREKVFLQHENAVEVLEQAARASEWLAQHFGDDSATVVAEQRYAYIHGAVRETVQESSREGRISLTEKLDTVILNRYAGLFIFFAVMFGIYQLTFAIGNPLSDLLDAGFAALGAGVSAILPAGLLRDLLVDGIIGGVGGVLVFFPIVLMLFMGLSFLEETGYMARAAFVMDRFFHLFGMHGRSFVPYMIATGCAVPAVLSARTLVNPRDRIITVLTTPMMLCGAKSPVVAMLAAAFFPDNAALVFWVVWLSGWLIAFATAFLFRKTLFRGEAAPFVMELPPYRMPTLRSVLHHMWERSWLYVKKAGTFILAASIVVWFLLTFPQAPEPVAAGQPGSDEAGAELAAQQSANEPITNEQNGPGEAASSESEQLANAVAHSYAGRIGHFVEPVLRPAGFDWKIGIGLFAGFSAKEVIVSTMAIVYGIGEADPDAEAGGERTPLKSQLTADAAYSPATALSLMFFVLIYVPCMAVLATVKKELGSWRWPAFLAAYTLVVAWLISVGVYQAATLLGLGA